MIFGCFIGLMCPTLQKIKVFATLFFCRFFSVRITFTELNLFFVVQNESDERN